MVLARLLGPEAFGLMALVLVVTRLFQPLADAGLHQAVIFHPDLPKPILSTLFWINMLLGILLFGLVMSGAPWLAKLLGDDRLIPLFWQVSPVFLLGPAASQLLALFTRDLQFDRLAKIQIGSLAGEFMVAVSLAWWGWGVSAMVFGYVTRFLVQGTLAWSYAGRAYLPSFAFQGQLAWPYLKFGLFETGNLLINVFSTQIDKALVGRLLGPALLGYYSIAWELIVFPIARINPIINRVSFPVFAQIKDQADQLNRYYERSVSFLLLVNIPALIGLAMVAPNFVEVFYGEAWLPAVPLIQILAVVGIHKAFANPGAGLLLAQGRADIGFYWNVGWTLALVSIIYLGLWWFPQLETSAWTQLLAALAFGWIWHWLVVRYGKVRYRRLLLYAGRTLLLCGPMVVVLWWFPVQTASPLLNLALELVLGALLFLVPYRFLFRAEWEAWWQLISNRSGQ